MNVQEVMTPRAEVVGPGDTLQAAARRMRDSNIGILPVGENGRLVGVITDRDIVVRAVADASDAAQCKVSEVMSTEVLCVQAGAPIEEAERMMGENQVRRLPVVDANRRLVGMVSLGDISLEKREDAGETLQDTTRPLTNRASGFASTD